MASKIPRNRLIGIIIGVLVVAAAIVVPIVVLAGDDDNDYTLTILHNNDGESKLLSDPDNGFPGIARFIEHLGIEQDDANRSSDGVITLTSGDNFLASKELDISLQGGTFYDALALSGSYDAMALGNHDFDFGPDIAARFISAFDPSIPFLSANLDVTEEPQLNRLVSEGKLARSVTIKKGGREIGVIGAVTDSLVSISSPRNAVVSDVFSAVQAEADRLTRDGVDIIILVSHLQDVDEELALARILSKVDVIIAGGGDELLANTGNTCLEAQNAQLVEAGEDPIEPKEAYPAIRDDATGSDVLIVTAPGGYRCFGRLDITFNNDGEATSYAGRSIGVSLDGSQDQRILTDVENPLNTAVSGLARDVISVSEVSLDGVRGNVRTRETNLGNVLADSFLWVSAQRAAGYGIDAPVAAVTNGGGIRNDSILEPGSITAADTFDIAPFGNDVVVMEISRETLKDVMETALSSVPDADGLFGQIGGFSVVYDESARARVIADSDCSVSFPGERVKSLTLDDGTVIVRDGNVVAGDSISFTITDFLASGGDCYPLADIEFTRMGLTYQQALAEYIETGLNASITASEYPEGGSGRISQ